MFVVKLNKMKYIKALIIGLLVMWGWDKLKKK